MRIKIIAIGKKMPAWVEQGWAEYFKRLPKEIKVELIELPLGGRGKTTSTGKTKQEEAERILAAVAPSDHIVALEVTGKSWSTEQLADNIAGWQMDGKTVALIIGGPDGLDAAVLNRAQQKWSLSALTLPHPLVRIVLIEQIYRGISLLNNHPYHK